MEKELTLQETGTGNHSVEKLYSYDHGDRLLSTRYIVKKGIDTQKDITLAANRYDALGQLKNKFLHANGSESSFREQLDYSYVPRSWLSKVTGKTGAGDNFGVELKYANPSQAGAQYNGNIAEMRWRRSAGGQWAGYKFNYHGVNRLTNGEGINGNSNREEIPGYDKNGNITQLKRWFDGNYRDQLNYSYNGNRLTRVTDRTQNGEGFNNGGSGDGDDYSYDAAGNATRDANRGIGNDGIKYNHLNLVREVGVNGHTLRYVYDGAGTKLRLQNETENTKYAGAFEYNQGNLLTRIATEEGQINVTNNGNDFTFEYYLKDHLGNTRMVMNEAGTMVQETEYFAFGLAISRTAGSNKYLYNGKEKQPETGLLDYGARQYDASIGRWMVVDPLSGLDENVSPYNYVLNSPTIMVDPSGMHPDSGANYAPGTNVETQYGSYTWTGEKWITHWEKPQDGGSTPTLFVPQLGTGSGNSQFRPNFDSEVMNSVPLLSWSKIGDANAMLGTVAGYNTDIQKSKLTFRFLKNLKPRFYASGWAGRAGMKTMNVASTIGKLSTVISVAFDGFAWSNGEQSGLKTIANIGVTAAAVLVGSVEGFVLGTGYLIIDKTVGWENAMELGANYQNQERALGLPTKPY